ncbi:MAG: PilZ domain-containing protein [Candidatus Omnitrophica bacterium]|nr:PilZ domain-containing protein [Candidatus Omnitrophota bacterium]
MTWKGKERRRFVRADSLCKITISSPQQHTIDCHTENIGAGGVRLLLDEKLEILSLVDLDVSLDDVIVKCKGRVVWRVERKVYNEKDFLFDTGVEFYEIDDESREKINSFVNNIITKEESGLE